MKSPTAAPAYRAHMETTIAAHAPLPWELDVGVTCISIRAYDGSTVCIDFGPEYRREETVANYTLIVDAVNGIRKTKAAA